MHSATPQALNNKGSDDRRDIAGFAHPTQLEAGMSIGRSEDTEKDIIIVDWDGSNDLENPRKYVVIRPWNLEPYIHLSP